MGESDGIWGELAEHDDELAEVWDGFDQLPEPGTNEALDSFVERKRITHGALVRVGARLAEHEVLAFAGPGYLKFRDVVTDKRWTYAGSEWSRMKIVKSTPTASPTRRVIIVEGESDAAWLTARVNECDVALMPAGALYFPQSYADQVRSYELVLVGLDNDSAGDRGAEKITEMLPNAVRLKPGGNDWCSTEDDQVSIPMPEDVPARIEMQRLVPAGELLDLEPPSLISWFEHGLLPVAGQLILHGWAKSFKSFLALDMLASLAQGKDWCCFEPTEEACRVAVMQYEIPWGYYQQRVKMLRANAMAPDLFDSNFLTFTPLQRPRFVAGNKAMEDQILNDLETYNVQVFLLDPVRRATGTADLNSEKEVRPLLAFFERLQDEGITVVTTHHDNKSFSRSGGGDPLGMTGVGAFAGDCDTIVSVSVPKGSDVSEPTRNMHFTFRNAPSLSPRGMKLGDDGHIVYSNTPFGLEDDASGPAI